MPTSNTSIAAKFILITVVVLSSILLTEFVIRIKNASILNYDIEMWKYSKELKRISTNTTLGHEHIPNASATLQDIDIRINNRGLRGGPIAETPDRRILILGSSITLGWGVDEEQTMSSMLQAAFHNDGVEQVEVLNAGIGNYNTVRYVEAFLTNLTDLDPTDIVVHYFINDAEVLTQSSGNIIMRHSQLAVTTWIMMSRFLNQGQRDMQAHYRQVYDDSEPGFIAMRESLERLATYCETQNIRLYLALIPDIHNLDPYPFDFIHDKVKVLSERLGIRYVDFLDDLQNIPAEDLWAMPGDPHPNAKGHRIMADRLYETLKFSEQ